ncbi:hypothetical protein Patl1_21323 [Pistacia atlantica]|uniref:Uncharacterized protein n=1 Tax=Pistacia atlantica TaxID=434234 RepID=A0ACC1BKM3_9ROSI|nr:hypothetical protein Patl1_21323 [Pistacia atlantica]
MDEQLFDAICNRLKPVLHTDESYIVREEEYKLQNELAKPGGIAPNLGVTIYATRFSANILRARRRNGKAEMLERVPAMLLQKPDEPDVSDEEPHR